MSAQFMQYLLTGLTVGAIYALVALGFSIIFNASHVINFAQGEFVMIGGMATVSLVAAGLPYLLAIPLAVVAAALVGLALEKFAVEPARDASVVSAQRSSGSRLWTSVLPQARASICTSSVSVCRKL